LSGSQKLMTRTRLSNFDRWDFAESALQTSPLYALNPRGLGTPLVESLGSYVIRLAEAHVVSVWRLILHVLSPPRPCRISRSTMRYAYPANGLGKFRSPSFRLSKSQRNDVTCVCLRYPLSKSVLHSPVRFEPPRHGAQAVWSNGARLEYRCTLRFFGPFSLSGCVRFTSVR